MAPSRDNDHSALALFAAELQAARARAGMSRDELAARINPAAWAAFTAAIRTGA